MKTATQYQLGEWRLSVNKSQISFIRDNAGPAQPLIASAFLKLRGKWIDCYRWQGRARALGVSETLIELAKSNTTDP